MPKDYVADELVERAQRETGLSQFDSESFREGLGLYIAEFNTNDRSDAANEANAAYVVKALSDRLKVADYLRQRPELLQRPIERPVFVFGVPRTGTTLLSNLLAADPNRRSPLSWEIDDPVPPPTSETLYNDPRALARLEQERALLAANPDVGKYYRFSAIYPNECVFWTIHDFKALIWEGRARLPQYREWLYSTDTTSTYEYHKRFLQVRQAEAPGIWNLKLPSHSLWLDTLLKIYPDARLIWTHRDPITATASYCSLMRLSMNTALGYCDMEWVGENFPWQTSEHARRVMATRARIGHDRIIDVHYADLMRTPMDAMRKLYAALGDDFTPEAEAGIQAWIDANPQGKFGRHEYRLAEWGLTADHIRARFEGYLAEYEVEPEG
ncbi:MAG: sulfotransferase [Novosphingobium sp.]